jgi:hypothetical protein
MDISTKKMCVPTKTQDMIMNAECGIPSIPFEPLMSYREIPLRKAAGETPKSRLKRLEK